jgi:hypothetical protein
MTDHTLGRLAQTASTDDRGWVCRTRIGRQDRRPVGAAGLVEQSARSRTRPPDLRRPGASRGGFGSDRVGTNNRQRSRPPAVSGS